MLIRKTLIAATVVAASFVAFQPQAQAGTKVGIYIGAGNPHFGYRPHRPYRAYPRYRPYRYYPGRYYAHRPYRPYVAPAAYYRWPAWRVRRSLRNRGYYRFSGMRYRDGYWIVRAAKNGKYFKLRVSSYSGAIVRRHRIY